MILCKHCGSSSYVKSGIIHGKQRYLCKACLKTYRLGDLRERYTQEQRLKVLKMYLEGVGIRSIERLENVPNSLIIKWIRKYANILRQKLLSTPIPNDIKDIQILEVDELFSYIQKNKTKHTYGLLLIGLEIKLLTLK